MKKDDTIILMEKFRQATCQMLILRTLCARPKYVYQIMSEISSKSDAAYSVGFAYPLIRRLQDEGYVNERTSIASADKRPRIYYEITEAGKEHMMRLHNRYCELVEITDNIWSSIEQEKTIDERKQKYS